MVLIKGKAYLILIKCRDASLDYNVVISIVMKTRSNSTPFTIYKKKRKKFIPRPPCDIRHVGDFFNFNIVGLILPTV